MRGLRWGVGCEFVGLAEVLGGAPGVVGEAVVDADALGAGEGFLGGEFALRGGLKRAGPVVASEPGELLGEFSRACGVGGQRGT